MQEIVNSVVAAVACRFMQNRHASRYLGSKRVTIFGGGIAPADPGSSLPEASSSTQITKNEGDGLGPPLWSADGKDTKKLLGAKNTACMRYRVNDSPTLPPQLLGFSSAAEPHPRPSSHLS
jgi:hypothetical protein